MTSEETNDIVNERDCGSCVWRSEDGCHSWDCDYISYHTFHQYIEQHPEIRGTLKPEKRRDVVNVVRCKDCKDWYPFPDRLFGYCRREYWGDEGQYRLNVETNHDDYCSYVERRDG